VLELGANRYNEKDTLSLILRTIPIRSFGFVHDNSEYKSSLFILKKLNKWACMVLSNVMDLVVTRDLHGRIKFIGMKKAQQSYSKEKTKLYLDEL